MLNTGFWSFISKIVGAANLFIVVPFVLADLGSELFGAWATLVSLSSVINFLDFGFGYGAMNLVASAIGRGARQEVSIVARTAATELLRITAMVLIAVSIALPLVPWHKLLGLPLTLASDAFRAAAVVLLTIAFAIPLNLSNRLQLGVGRGERAFGWQAAGQLMALIATLLVSLNGGSLALCVAATVGVPLIASVLNTVSFYAGIRADKPTVPIDVRVVKRAVRREGTQFFVLQLAAVLAFGIDLPLIAFIKGPEAAGHYAIVQRLFSVIPMGLSLFWAPLWPVYRHAFSGGDLPWAFKTLRRAVVFAVTVASIGGIAIATLFQPLSQFWLHQAIAVDALLLCGFAAWCVLEGAGTAVATFLNAASVIDFQVRTSCVFAVLCVGCKYLVIRHLTVDEVPWSTVFTYVATSVVPFLLYRRRIFNRIFALRS